MSVFICGTSHLISENNNAEVKKMELPSVVRDSIDKLLNDGTEILLGDRGTINCCVQKYLSDKNYKKVTVYVPGSKHSTKINSGCWPEKHFQIEANTLSVFHMEKDFRMAEDAEYGIVIWDGDSTESFINMLYLAAQGKMSMLFNLKEERWEDIRAVTDLGCYTGEEGVIGAEEVRKVMTGCGFSDEMIEYSVSSDSVSPYQLIDIICRAPISLDEKMYFLNVLCKQRNLKYDVYNSVCENITNIKSIKEIKHDIRAMADYRCKESIWSYIWSVWKEISHAKEVMYNSYDDMFDCGSFYLFDEWYDADELRLKSEPCGLFPSPEVVEKYILNEETDNEYCGEGYYRMESWDNSDSGWDKERYDYYFYRGKICWFQKLIPEMQENGNKAYFPKDRKFTSGKLDLDIKTPYMPGDVVLIDCRPFGPAFYALVLEARDQWDCCFPTILFNIVGTQKWKIAALKHRMFYKDISWGTYEPMLSPLFRIRKITQEEIDNSDSEDVNMLLALGNEMAGSEERAALIWDTWNKRSYDENGDMTVDDVRNLFRVLHENN